jgi:hypothetical protein
MVKQQNLLRACVLRDLHLLLLLYTCRWADKNGMATEPGAPTNYAELTIGGVISANGHGTGSNVTSSMVRQQQERQK